jgi:glycosyltransferase involved in cell wall biosynthesis
MAQNKRFSFIIPLYKGNFKTLDKCLLHILEQDYKNYEIVFVHNSPDMESKKALKKYSKQLTEANIEFKELDAGYDKKLGNGNHCNAFNVGAENSTGDYLIFSDPDVYIYPGILREYKDAFDQTNADFVYGDYDFVNGGGRIMGREYSEYELKCANYISGAFPIKKEAFKGWDKNLESLQDWDMRLNAVDQGARGYYIARPCFQCELSEKGGISSHSHDNWEKVYKKVRDKHFPLNKTVVTSLGAPKHATNMAEILGADTRVQSNILNFKPHAYENIYLLGFYPLAWQPHLSLFYQLGQIKDGVLAGKKRVIHWIGTDIFQMQHKLSWVTWQNMLKILNEPELNFIHLSECEQTQRELEELGIKSDIVPLPTKQIDLSPLPEKFTVGVYINPTQDMYFEDFMYEVADAMPDIQFKFFGNQNMFNKKEKNKEWVGWVDMKEFLPTISSLVRLTVHDGLPLGPIEAMMAGRNVLTSIKIPHALHTEINGEPNKKDVVTKIRQMKKMELNKEASEYWKKEMSYDLYQQRMSKYL